VADFHGHRAGSWAVYVGPVRSFQQHQPQGRKVQWGEEKMKIITVKHEVSPERGKCTFGGDYCGKDVCKYHALRTQTHGRKAPPEYRKPKCLLFDCWLEQPYKKCEACKKACMEAEYDNGTTSFHG
jgi:hypothetical protein